jgi:hypothetical protein
VSLVPSDDMLHRPLAPAVEAPARGPEEWDGRVQSPHALPDRPAGRVTGWNEC